MSIAVTNDVVGRRMHKLMLLIMLLLMLMMMTLT